MATLETSGSKSTATDASDKNAAVSTNKNVNDNRTAQSKKNDKVVDDNDEKSNYNKDKDTLKQQQTQKDDKEENKKDDKVKMGQKEEKESDKSPEELKADKEKEKLLEKKKERKKKFMRTYHVAALMVTLNSGRDLWMPHDPDPVKSKCPKNVQAITRDKLLSMLKRENEIRLSDKTLRMLENEVTTDVDADVNDINISTLDEDLLLHTDLMYDNASSTSKLVFKSNVFENIQKQVIGEFGYNVNNEEELNYGLEMLRSASYLYPNDKDIMDSVYYLKYNRAREGELKIGDKYPNIESLLFFNSGNNKFESISLSNIVKMGNYNNDHNDDSNDKPCVIISGSMT